MNKLNCWEVLKCGLEPGGAKAKEFGVCIAATEKRLDCVNEGKNAGRACWAILGTLCHEDGRPKRQDTYSQKLKRCTQCRFFELVAIQEGDEFKNTRMILEEYEKDLEGNAKTSK
jgi:eukaryotic-like serine/threonine-protein kinase